MWIDYNWVWYGKRHLTLCDKHTPQSHDWELLHIRKQWPSRDWMYIRNRHSIHVETSVIWVGLLHQHHFVTLQPGPTPSLHTFKPPASWSLRTTVLTHPTALPRGTSIHLPLACWYFGAFTTLPFFMGIFGGERCNPFFKWKMLGLLYFFQSSCIKIMLFLMRNCEEEHAQLENYSKLPGETKPSVLWGNQKIWDFDILTTLDYKLKVPWCRLQAGCSS